MSELFTPSTDDIRATLVYLLKYQAKDQGDVDLVVVESETAAQFDRWLAEHDRQVAERAWGEGAQWAAVECGAIRDERVGWVTEEENPYRTTNGEEQ